MVGRNKTANLGCGAISDDATLLKFCHIPAKKKQVNNCLPTSVKYRF